MPHDASDLRPDRSRRVAIIGAGPGGICTAVRLLERGHHDFVILEKAPGIGGTWWHNRYPGAECDIKSHLYSFSFAPNPAWSRAYARQPEIKAYLEECVERFGLGPHLRLGTEVHAMRWNETDAVWRLTVGRRRRGRGGRRRDQRPRHVRRAGRSRHPRPRSVRGDDLPLRALGRRARPHGRSGGGDRQRGERGAARPRDRADRRAARPLPALGELGAPEGGRPVHRRAARRRSRRDADAITALRDAIFATVDPNLTFADPERRALWPRPPDATTSTVVEDPEVRTQLTPDVPFGCKRPLASNVYYPTFNRPNVELVTEPITGDHRARGRHRRRPARPVDTIILATGFATTKFLAALDVVGRDGVRHRRRVDRRPPGVPRHHHQRVPEPVHALRAEHQQRLDHLHDRVPGRLRHAAVRRAWTTTGSSPVDVKREVMDEYNAALQDTLAGVEVWQAGCRRLLPRAVGAHRHAVAGIDVGVPRPHATSRPRRIRERHPHHTLDTLDGRFRCAVPPSGHGSAASRMVHRWSSGSPSRTPAGTRRPTGCATTATVAEEAGWDSLWGVDHLVMPQHTDSEYTLGRKPAKIADDAVSGLLSPNYEMMTTLTWIAGFTERIKLGTAVAVLPIRNAVQNARILATLDVYSGGRVLYGVGVGWLREEAEAMGMPWDRRGARSEEHIALMRTLWCAEGDLVEFHGEFHDLPPMDPEPRPVQRPIPILDRRPLRHRARARRAHRRRLDRGPDVARAGRRALAARCRRRPSAAGRDPGALQLFTSISGRKRPAARRPPRAVPRARRRPRAGRLAPPVTARSTLDMIRDVAENVVPDLRTEPRGAPWDASANRSGRSTSRSPHPPRRDHSPSRRRHRRPRRRRRRLPSRSAPEPDPPP